jgi:hypothetical protein
MSVEVTISLPDSLVNKVQAINSSLRQDAQEVVTDTLEAIYPMLENSAELFSPDIPSMSDEEVLQLADSKMDRVQGKRLGALQTKGKAIGLSPAERHELLALFQIYQTGLLRKSEAMVEAVRRGLRKPITA